MDDSNRSKRGETFRREGDAEILELDNDENDNENEADLEEDELDQSQEMTPRRPRIGGPPSGLDVVEEVDETLQTPAGMSNRSVSIGLGPDFERRNVSQMTDEELVDQELAASMEADRLAALRKISENREQQTDLTFAHINKKVQADTLTDLEQNSDVDGDDTDAASSVLSHSLRSNHSHSDNTRYFRYLNMTN